MLSAPRSLSLSNRKRVSINLSNGLLNSNKAKLLANFLAFQTGWAVAVLMGSLYAGIYTLAHLLFHQIFILEYKREWLFIGVIALIGILADTAFRYLGVLDFGDDGLMIPPWLMCLWVLFGTTLCHSLAWLRKLPVLAILFAAVAGPASYFAGARLAGGALGEPLWLSLSGLSLWWGLFFPMVMFASRWVYDK